MGGKGFGHKSAKAVLARQVNIQKARAARRRAPLPWRSGIESRIIEQLVWQWWMEKNSDERRVTLRSSGQASDERRQQQIPHRHPAKAAGWVRDDRVDAGNGGQAAGRPSRRAQSVAAGAATRLYKDEGKEQRDSTSRAGAASSAPTKAKRRWTKYRVARFFGVSHTWVNKLMKRFEAEPERMRRRMAAFAPASWEKLQRAREETRRQRERGWLREPIRTRRVTATLGGKKMVVVAATRAEKQRRQERAEYAEAWARQGKRGVAGRDVMDGAATLDAPAKERAANGENQQQIPHTAETRPVRNDKLKTIVVRRDEELPLWARGLLPEGAGTAGRAVPFAFRRRR